MLIRLFPQPATNEYRGSPVAKWVFILLTALTIGRSLAHILLPDGGAPSIAAIPLESFTTTGADVLIGILAQWGLSQLLFGLLFVTVL